MNYLDKLYDAFESDEYVPESDLQFWWSQLTQFEKNEFADYMGMSISGVEEELGLDNRFGSSKRKGSRKGSVSKQSIEQSYDKWLFDNKGYANANEFIYNDLKIDEYDNYARSLVVDVIDDIEGTNNNDPLPSVTLNDIRSHISSSNDLTTSDFSDPHTLYNALFFRLKVFGNHQEGSDNVNNLVFDNFNSLKSEFENSQRTGSRRKGSRKGSTVQQIVDAFDDIDNTSHEQLIQLAKDLPDGLGEDVIYALGVGAWRGDTPEEEEFFRIIDSKFPRRGSRKGQDFTAHGIRNAAQGFKDATGGQTKERMSNAWDTWDRKRSGSRVGSGPLNNLGTVSGKGSRPDNLGEIATKVSLGRHRSINMDGEYVEPSVIEEPQDEVREGGILRDTAKIPY